MKCVIEIHQDGDKLTVIARVPKEAEGKTIGILTNELVRHSDQILKAAFKEAGIEPTCTHQ